MALLDHIRTLALAYQQARKLSPGRVSRLAFGDGTKLPDILQGTADLTTKRYEKTIDWFSINWPEGVSWPQEMPRPPRAV